MRSINGCVQIQRTSVYPCTDKTCCPIYYRMNLQPRRVSHSGHILHKTHHATDLEIKPFMGLTPITSSSQLLARLC